MRKREILNKINEDTAMTEEDVISELESCREKVKELADRVSQMEKTVGVSKDWPFPRKDYKQYDMSYDQVDQIVINEMKETIQLNWNDDHDMVAAAMKVLAYYMHRSEYDEYVEELRASPPRDSNYDNTN